jgi:hypothetical protein
VGKEFVFVGRFVSGGTTVLSDAFLSLVKVEKMQTFLIEG